MHSLISNRNIVVAHYTTVHIPSKCIIIIQCVFMHSHSYSIIASIGVKVVSSEFYFHKPITVHIELYLFYCFIHFLLYIGQY